MFGNPELTKRIAALEQEVARQQVVINEIIRQTGVEMPSGAGLPSNNEPSMYGNLPTTLPPRAQQALAAGKKIEAIKLVREEYGFGLKEAKDFVERFERSQNPGAGVTGSSAWN